MRATIILCSSENVGKDKNQPDTLAKISRILLYNKIKRVPVTDEIVDQGIEISRDVDESDLLLTDINSGNTCQNNEKLHSNKMQCCLGPYILSCVNESGNAVEGVDINPYYYPVMAQKIKYLLPYFPLYSEVMIPNLDLTK